MTGMAVVEEQEQVEISPVAWAPQGEMEFEDWREAGRKLGQIARATQWWIGDWLNYGANNYGEKYVEAVEVTGYDPTALMNMAYVAGRFEISRRREILSWSHHQDVAALPEQEADAALEHAEREGLSSKQLRSYVSGGNGERTNGRQSLTVRLVFEQSFPNRQLQRKTVEALREQAEALGFKERAG